MFASHSERAYWSAERIRGSGYYQYFVYQSAANYAAGLDSCTFVDVGCGYPTKVAELIAPITDDIILIDQPSMESMIHENFPNTTFLPLDLEKIESTPLIRANCIVCADVIEHLLDPVPTLELIQEILCPGGLAFISTPERDLTRGTDCLASPKPEHVREWNFHEFNEFLSSSGFEVVEHRLLPKGRPGIPWKWGLSWIQRITKNAQYTGCQMAVCRLPDHDQS